MEHTLPKLPCAQDALAPQISLETMPYHYGKHHQAYVDNLNTLIKGAEFSGQPLEAIINQAPAGGIFNNAAQAWNHASFWTCLVKQADGSLAMVDTTGAQTPLTGSDKPLLSVDVWEHACYIDYRNQRPENVEAFLGHLVNWESAARNFE